MESVKDFFRNPTDYKTATDAWNSLSSSKQNNLFDEIFMDCLRECENYKVPLQSYHANQNIKLFTLSDNLPTCMHQPSLPHPFQPLVNLLRFCEGLQNVDAFLLHVIERLSSYLLAPLSENSRYLIQTPSITYETTNIFSDMIYYFTPIFSDFDCSYRTQERNVIFMKMADTFAAIASHPELHVELFLPCVMTLCDSSDGSRTWRFIDAAFRKKMIESSLDTIKKLVNNDSPGFNRATKSLLVFVFGLQILGMANEEETDAAILNTMSECAQSMLDTASDAMELEPSFFDGLSNILRSLCGQPGVSSEECAKLALKFFQAADSKGIVCIPPSAFGRQKLENPQKIQLLEATRHGLSNPNTIGMSFQLMAYYLISSSETHNNADKLWYQQMDTPSVVATLLEYIRSNSMHHNQTAERFKYLKTAAIRCLLALLSCTSAKAKDTWFNTDGERLLNGVYQSLGDLLCDQKFLLEILNYWKESDVEMYGYSTTLGCQNETTVDYIISQIIKAIRTIVLSGGALEAPTSNCVQLCRFYISQSRESGHDQPSVRHSVNTHLNKLTQILEYLKDANVPILSSVVPLKQLATKKLLQQDGGTEMIKTAFPGATEYLNSMLDRWDVLREDMTAIVLQLMISFFDGYGELAPDNFVQCVMPILPKLVDAPLVISLSVELLGAIIGESLTKEQRLFSMEHLWPIIEKAVFMDSDEVPMVIEAITSLIVHWDESLAKFPLVPVLMKALRNPYVWDRSVIVEKLVQLTENYAKSDDMKFLMDDMRGEWMTTLPALMQHSLNSTVDQQAFSNFLDLFLIIFYQHDKDYQQLIAKNWPEVPQNAVTELFELLMAEESFSKRVRALSSTLGIPFNKFHRKRKREPDELDLLLTAEATAHLTWSSDEE